MQVETPEVGIEKATTPAYKVGDKVTFSVVQATRKSIRISVKEGTIYEIYGARATVKYRNGMKGNVMLKHLTHASERNALTRALMGEASE